jgi:uncharacterized protein with von Willebrand factor type A (vWA) domain
MRRYRYSAWNTSLGCFHPDPEDVLDGIADSIIEHGDLRKALRLLMQQGFTDQRGRFVPGLRDIRDRLFDMRQQALAEYDSKDMVRDWRLMEIDRLDRMLDSVFWGSDADTIDDDLVRKIMGNEARRQVCVFKELTKGLERYVDRNGTRLELTVRGIRRIAQRAMLDVFSSLRRGSFGGHAIRRNGVGGERLEDSRPYQFGDAFAINLGRTIMNATQRADGRASIRLAAQDFEVYETESAVRCTTVLLLDMSGSMARHGRFAAAKRVALALDALIRTQFPRDRLHVVGFCTYAQELQLADIPSLSPKPLGFFPHFYRTMYRNPLGFVNVQVDAAEAAFGRASVPAAFTNIQAGLQVAGRLLNQQRAGNQQVILITDGEPTAHMRGRSICLEYPPSPQTLTETLKEAKRCTRRGITINTFMLGENDPMKRFVSELTKVNRGRAFFASPTSLGEYILVDYVANHGAKAA